MVAVGHHASKILLMFFINLDDNVDDHAASIEELLDSIILKILQSMSFITPVKHDLQDLVNALPAAHSSCG